jgi:hypothetical protein
MRMNQGEEFQAALQLQKFNYEKNRAEPVDLTGCQVMFRVYKPIEKVTLTVTLQPSGRSLDFEVPLTEEQSIEYMRLADEPGRTVYAQRIVESTPVLRDALQIACLDLVQEQLASDAQGGGARRAEPGGIPPDEGA